MRIVMIVLLIVSLENTSARTELTGIIACSSSSGAFARILYFARLHRQAALNFRSDLCDAQTGLQQGRSEREAEGVLHTAR